MALWRFVGGLILGSILSVAILVTGLPGIVFVTALVLVVAAGIRALVRGPTAAEAAMGAGPGLGGAAVIFGVAVALLGFLLLAMGMGLPLLPALPEFHLWG